MTENRIFIDNGWNFPPALDMDGTPTRMSAYEENICQSLCTLLGTSHSERIHRYDYEADRSGQRHPLLAVACPADKVLSEKRAFRAIVNSRCCS